MDRDPLEAGRSDLLAHPARRDPVLRPRGLDHPAEALRRPRDHAVAAPYERRAQPAGGNEMPVQGRVQDADRRHEGASPPDPPTRGPLACRADEPRPRHRRRRHDRLGRRAAAAGPPRLRGPRGRPARGARLDARGLRGPGGRPARPRRHPRGDGRLHARHPPRGDRRRHPQLPPAAAHPDRGQQRALQQHGPRRARPPGAALRLRVELDGLRARHPVPHHRGPHLGVPDAALGLRVLEAHRRGLLPGRARPSTACPTRSAAPSTHTARASGPTTSPGSPTWSPT